MALSTTQAEPYSPIKDYRLIQPYVDINPDNIAKYDDGSRIKEKQNNQQNRSPQNPCTLSPQKGYVKNHAGIYKHRAKTIDEYQYRVKFAIQKAWHSLTNTDGPPADTVIALFFDKDGALRYVNIIDIAGIVDDEHILLEAAWDAGSFPSLLKDKDIKPLIISW